MKFARKFKCPKLVFSPVCIDDAMVLFDAVRSEKFPSSLPLAKIETLKQAESWCSERALDWDAGKCFVWTCHRSSDSVIIGQVTLFPQENRLALAYWVNPELWGQGLATQMCESLLSHIQREGYRGNVWAGVHTWNTRSASVLKKLGFTPMDSGAGDTAEYNLAI
ncbi:Acetyltransferase (GNAT) family protein [Vibrio aerogenes CECT 7868]|uniref:Acetyltransferase (GNAT) family protein n=1 Tax=Vibrio aerogenes CECT 7868 TaxID=1216006 RepID=A0A1M5VID6_9VIBR|nr:GNAT family N-acetyltransferase [Vibrio aerogenes]SHH74663.1 Acetyltransferase (GNAT) family protein [Vibrio aerogenes CECT 7868]